MFILKGKSGKTYYFKGPFNGLSEIKSIPGIYAVLCNSMVTKTGVSGNIRKSLEEFVKSNAAKKCKGVLEYIVLYKYSKNKKSLIETEKEISNYYNPPWNKLKQKSASVLKRYGFTYLIILVVLTIILSFITIDCVDTPTSLRYAETTKTSKNTGKIFDSVQNLYFKDNSKLNPPKLYPLIKKDSYPIPDITFPDTGLIFSPLDSSSIKSNIAANTISNVPADIEILKDTPVSNNYIKQNLLKSHVRVYPGNYIQIFYLSGGIITYQKIYFPLL